MKVGNCPGASEPCRALSTAKCNLCFSFPSGEREEGSLFSGKMWSIPGSSVPSFKPPLSSNSPNSILSHWNDSEGPREQGMSKRAPDSPLRNGCTWKLITLPVNQCNLCSDVLHGFTSDKSIIIQTSFDNQCGSINYDKCFQQLHYVDAMHNCLEIVLPYFSTHILKYKVSQKVPHSSSWTVYTIHPSKCLIGVNAESISITVIKY